MDCRLELEQGWKLSNKKENFDATKFWSNKEGLSNQHTKIDFKGLTWNKRKRQDHHEVKQEDSY